jgi:hypothetical protein
VVGGTDRRLSADGARPSAYGWRLTALGSGRKRRAGHRTRPSCCTVATIAPGRDRTSPGRCSGIAGFASTAVAIVLSSSCPRLHPNAPVLAEVQRGAAEAPGAHLVEIARRLEGRRKGEVLDAHVRGAERGQIIGVASVRGAKGSASRSRGGGEAPCEWSAPWASSAAATMPVSRAATLTRRSSLRGPASGPASDPLSACRPGRGRCRRHRPPWRSGPRAPGRPAAGQGRRGR